MPGERRTRGGFRVVVDPDCCDGCGICLFFCRPRVFDLAETLSARGFYVAEAVRPEDCTGCALCELGCPHLAIFVGGAAPAAAEAHS